MERVMAKLLRRPLEIAEILRWARSDLNGPANGPLPTAARSAAFCGRLGRASIWISATGIAACPGVFG